MIHDQHGPLSKNYDISSCDEHRYAAAAVEDMAQSFGDRLLDGRYSLPIAVYTALS